VKSIPQQAWVTRGLTAALAKRRIIASTTPYAVSYARVTPSLLNDPADVAHMIQALTQIARGRRSAAL
jgi:selenocysteine lyase/cysteine desulfurase